MKDKDEWVEVKESLLEHYKERGNNYTASDKRHTAHWCHYTKLCCAPPSPPFPQLAPYTKWACQYGIEYIPVAGLALEINPT